VQKTLLVLLQFFLLIQLLTEPGISASTQGEVRSGTTVGESSQAGSVQQYNTFRLKEVVDSLARASDSLKTLVDSLLSPAEPVGKALSPWEPGKDSPEKLGREERALWEGSIGLGATLNRGNTSQSTLVATFELERRAGRTRFSSKSSVTATNSNKDNDADKGVFKNKFEIVWNRHIFYFGSLDLDYNRQAGIDLRVAPGFGLGIAVVSRPGCSLELGFGANPITEFRRNQPRRTKGHYLGSQELKIALGKRIMIDQSFSYKPRADRLEEYLINFRLSLINKLTSGFALKMNLEGRYNSRPPEHDPPYRRQDWMFYTSLNYSIR